MIADERLRRVEELCHAALERDPQERGEFIRTACAGDDGLQREVESLLVHSQTAEEFLAVPAAEFVAGALARDGVSLIGQCIAHYRIVEKVGAGGMGVVYRADDTKLRRPVALKFLSPDLTGDEEAKRRFVLEAQAASALEHPNICTIYEIGEAPDGQIFLAMAYYAGETVKTKIERGPLALQDALAYAIQIAEGLVKAHASGIVHRDIKPANVLITGDGMVKIVDFGIAKLIGHTSVTQRGATAGTSAYMSPEHTAGAPVDARSDVWSLGVVLYEMVAGRLPFRGDQPQGMALAVAHVPPEQLTMLRPEVPLALERIVDRALAKGLDNRYQTAAEMLSALRQASRTAEHQPSIRLGFANPDDPAVAPSNSASRKSLAPPDRASRANRRTMIGAALGLVIFSSTALVGWKVIASRNPPPARTALRSVAVLPFANLTGSSEQDYFVDGLTQQLTSELARVTALEVISGAAASRYNRSQSGPEIARQLGQIDGLIEGGVSRSGDNVSVMIELVDARTDRQLWTRVFDGQLRDILTLYSDISRAVANEINNSAAGTAVAPRSDARRIVNPDAYDKFLQARYFSHGWQAGGCTKAEPLLLEATNLDPSLAEAYAELAFCYAYPDMLRRSGSDVVPAAHQAIARALMLDETSAVAHSVLGEIKYRQDFDWAAARRAFQRALELNGNDGYANFMYGQLLYVSGQTDEGLAFLREGMRFDPLSADLKTAYGAALRLVGQPDGAIEQLDRVIASDPIG